MKKKIAALMFAITATVMMTACGNGEVNTQVEEPQVEEQVVEDEIIEEVPEEIVEGEENLDVTPEDNSEALDVRLFSFMPDDESIDYFKDFYIQHAWTPGISNSIVVYKYDGTVICEKEYNVSENAEEYGCWYNECNGDPYICFLGMETDSEYDSAVINIQTGEIIWENINFPDYYINKVVYDGGDLFAALCKRQGDEYKYILLDTEEEFSQINNTAYVHYEILADGYDTDKWGTFVNVNYDSYYFAQSADGECWAYLDMDMNEKASFKDATMFTTNGYACVSNDRLKYSIIDKDCNIVMENITDGVSASYDSALDTIVITKENGDKVLVIIN